MTEDFKKNLLKYITNEINPTSPSTNQILENVIDIPRTNFSNFIPDDYRYFTASNIIQSSTNGYFILYGGYVPYGETPTSDSRGFIMILDENLNPIKTIFEFSSGTTLRPIQKMIQTEDGTFVAVDSTIFALPEYTIDIQNNEKRFIMLNNFSVKGDNDDYVVKLRTSYKIPTSYQNFFCMEIVKNPNTAHYLLAGTLWLPTQSGHYDGARVIDLKINVGAANEWTNKNSNSDYWIYGGFYGEFDNSDNASWKMILTHNVSNELTTMGWWNGSTYTVIMNSSGEIQPYVDSKAMRNQAVFINYDVVYFVINDQRWGESSTPRYIGLYKYTFSTGTLKQIYLKSLGSFDYLHSREGIFLTALNGELYINYCDNFNYDNETANYHFQRLENDEWNPILISENAKYLMEKTLAYTFNIYNLVSNVVLNQYLNFRYWKLEIIKEIYNNLNYNSTSYLDYDSLIAHSGTLYSNNDIVFARNLYNKTSLNNTTVSTIEVPNTMLNNIDITSKNLFGETNLQLVQDTNTLTKNIYETLFVNFINTINVIDEDTNIRFPLASNYVNSNINTGTQTNSEESSVAKVRINYGDNTSKIFDISWQFMDDFNRKTSYSLYVDKEIESIDYISNDESIVYCKKELDLEVGNIYTITQKIRTGIALIQAQLQYNNEDIYYNGEPVMVYTKE